MIKIVNETEYRTRDLRRFVTRCAKIAFQTKADRRYYGDCTIYFRYGAKRHRVSGYAYCHGGPAYVLFDRGEDPCKPDLAYVLVHELGHVKGLKHGDMSRLVRYDWTKGSAEFYAWADDLPLEKRPEPKPAPEPDPVAERLAKIERYLAKIEIFTRKRRFADTKIKTYKRKIRALRAAQTRAAKK